jgi:hypothetical protein
MFDNGLFIFLLFLDSLAPLTTTTQTQSAVTVVALTATTKSSGHRVFVSLI